MSGMFNSVWGGLRLVFRWFLGLEFMSRVFKRVYYGFKRHGSNKGKKGGEERKGVLYGFKHPRSVLLLPYMKAVLGDGFKYIHVIRDGREVATGNNKRFYRDICSLFHEERKWCTQTKKNRLRFWASFNIEMIEWFRKHGGRQQFLVVRAEDLVNNKPECLERVARFLGANVNPSEKLAADYARFVSSYNGNKLSLEDRIQLTKYTSDLPQVNKALRIFGYQQNASMGTVGHCTNLDL